MSMQSTSTGKKDSTDHISSTTRVSDHKLFSKNNRLTLLYLVAKMTVSTFLDLERAQQMLLTNADGDQTQHSLIPMDQHNSPYKTDDRCRSVELNILFKCYKCIQDSTS
uniref:Uncharacterized protein n=1 Tax=Cucumis melo TaxID=3656 RepID=A0A9I9E6P8_CUCME